MVAVGEAQKPVNFAKPRRKKTEFAWCLPYFQHSATSTCIVEIEPLILHGNCDIWKIDPLMLHGICRILQITFAAFLNFNLPFCMATSILVNI